MTTSFFLAAFSLGAVFALSDCRSSDEPNEDICAPIEEICRRAASGPLGDLLDQEELQECASQAKSKNNLICERAAEHCESVCIESRVPQNEADVSGCWYLKSSDVELCLGYPNVQGTRNPHAYSWWSASDQSAPVFVGEYETLENGNRPGVMILYNAPSGGMARCYLVQVATNKDHLFTSEGVESQGICPSDLGGFALEWERW